MKKYLISQSLSIVIAILLVFTFYMLLAGALVSGQNFMSDMILIVIAVILLAMFNVLTKIEFHLMGGKKK